MKAYQDASLAPGQEGEGSPGGDDAGRKGRSDQSASLRISDL